MELVEGRAGVAALQRPARPTLAGSAKYYDGRPPA